MKNSPVTTLFIDIGGVLLTNGWDHIARKLAAKKFGFDFNEMESRHSLVFATYEVGKMTLDNYLDYVIFYQKRSFTRAQFRKFMFSQSEPYPEMMIWVQQIKKKHRLKIAVVSNESRELNNWRIQKYQLGNFVDFFICSCFVQLRKPDADIYRLALDIAQASPAQVIYIDDRLMFAEVAESLGIQSICHMDYVSTRAKFEKLI